MNQFMENPHKIIHQLDLIVNQDLEYYGNLIRMKGNSSLNTKIVELLKNRIQTDLLKEYPQTDPEKITVAMDFIFSGVVETFRIWFNKDRKIPINEVAEIIEMITFSGVKTLLKCNRK